MSLLFVSIRDDDLVQVSMMVRAKERAYLVGSGSQRILSNSNCAIAIQILMRQTFGVALEANAEC